jgi:hypothetical protein
MISARAANLRVKALLRNWRIARALGLLTPENRDATRRVLIAVLIFAFFHPFIARKQLAEAERLARQKSMTEAQARRLIGEIVERTSGTSIQFHTCRAWLSIRPVLNRPSRSHRPPAAHQCVCVP